MADEFKRLDLHLSLEGRAQYAFYIPIGILNNKDLFHLQDSKMKMLNDIREVGRKVKLLSEESVQTENYMQTAKHTYNNSLQQNVVIVFRDFGAESRKPNPYTEPAEYHHDLKPIYEKYPCKGLENVFNNEVEHEEVLPRLVQFAGQELSENLEVKTFEYFDDKGIGLDGMYDMNTMANMKKPFSETVYFMSEEARKHLLS